MVTADFAKGAAVTILAGVGLLIGFRIQDTLKRQNEEELEQRVEREYQRRLAERAAKTASSSAASAGASGTPPAHAEKLS